jgi:hypothetical protein
MAKRTPTPAGLLRLAISSGLIVEAAAADKRLRRPLSLTGVGCLIRNRRIAQAILRLGAKSAYESRILMRTMLEIQNNYAWIRLKKSHSRAIRFHRFVPIERLKILKQMNSIMKEAHYEQMKQRLEAERSKLRVFRFRDSKNKMQWAKSWAAVSSVEARLTEVLSAERPDKPVDPFWYGMYISFSSATHGSPGSLNEVVQRDGDRLVAKEQPEIKPSAHQRVAAIVLAWTIAAVTEDVRLRRQLRRELKPLDLAMAALQARAKAAAVNVRPGT